MKKTNVTIAGRDMVALDCDNDHILHRIGGDDYPVIRHTKVNPGDEDGYEEIAVSDIPPYTKGEYDAEVERLIALRYSHGKEVEINRERDIKPERFAEYMEYIGQCKAEAKANLATAAEARAIAEVEQAAAEAFGAARSESDDAGE